MLKAREHSRELTAAAEAALDLVRLTARLKSCPSRTIDVRGARSPLELDVGAERRHEHRAAVAVVAGVDDVLQAGREINAAPHVHGVVRLHDIFAAVIESAVAEQEAEAAIGEVGLVILLNCV